MKTLAHQSPRSNGLGDKNMKPINFVKISTLLACILITNVANAALPVGLWKLDQYDFVTKVKLNTVFPCVKNDGSFVIDTNWSGHWKKTGDLLLFRMNNTITPEWSSAYSLIVSNTKLMTGHGVGWIGSTGTANDTYTSTVWTFQNAIC